MHIELASPDDVPDLARLLIDSVDGGACVGFPAGLTQATAERFWVAALPGARTWVARSEGGTVGVVQLRPATLPNGSHRADVAKLLVLRRAHGHGVATALMDRAEQDAWAHGRWLLQLDTETGSAAQRLYEQRGWQVLGVIADHAVRPSGELSSTTFMVKRLRHAVSGPG